MREEEGSGSKRKRGLGVGQGGKKKEEGVRKDIKTMQRRRRGEEACYEEERGG